MIDFKIKIAELAKESLDGETYCMLSKVIDALDIGWTIPEWNRTSGFYSNDYMDKVRSQDAPSAFEHFLTQYALKHNELGPNADALVTDDELFSLIEDIGSFKRQCRKYRLLLVAIQSFERTLFRMHKERLLDQKSLSVARTFFESLKQDLLLDTLKHSTD